MTVRGYPAYKESGIEWLGKVPTSWATLSLKRVSSITYGLGQPPEYVDTGVRFLRATNVKRGSLSTEGLVHIANPAPGITRIARLKVGDIIVVRSGAYTGDSAIVTPDWEHSVAGFDMIVRVGNDIIASFLASVLLSSYVLEAQIALSKLRAAQPHLNAEELGEVVLVLPPLDQQAAIAAFLDRETGKIDALVAEQERLIALLKEKRQAVISHAVTKGLNPDAPMKDSGVPWLGEVPAHWNVTRAKTCAVLITSGPRGWSERISDDGVLFIQSGDLDDDLQVQVATAKRVNVNLDAEARRSRLRDGDVVVCITGAKTGNVGLFHAHNAEAYINQHLALIRPNRDSRSRFLGYVLKGKPGQLHFDTSQYGLKQGLSLHDVESAPIALPPIVEQDKIIDFLDVQIMCLDLLHNEVIRAIALLRERRAALISAAVTGKIDVRGLAALPVADAA